QQGKVKYGLTDCLVGGFAMMFFQDASILEFQRRWEEDEQRSNLQSIFGLEKTPSDSQFREILDAIHPDSLYDTFTMLYNRMQRGKFLESFEFLHDRYIIAIDATEYFHSETINCSNCLTKKINGVTHYSHSVLQAAMVHPDLRNIIPLEPEAISNSDGAKKQDCELNAAKRWLNRFRRKHPKIKAFIAGGGLYSHEPFIHDLKEADFSFLLVAKPADHKFLFQKLEQLEMTNKLHTLEVIDSKNNMHTYRWANELPIKSDNRLKINYFSYELFNADKDKITYKNSWVTDIAVAQSNIVALVRGARARWKVENEGFNTLKNHGYEIEHNYGHGSKNLSYNFYLLNLLAFFTHQILEMTCRLYKKARAKFSARKEYWNQMRCTFRIMQFQCWNEYIFRIIGRPRPP
ncbi:MAG: hypothetical protein OEV78_12900, partial [Spirochaetia bacterium]|nr:hypothetical protein [Spirochaetia bacterium]